MMPLSLKHDWERSVERFRAFWEGQAVDRAIVQVMAPTQLGRPKGWWRILDEPTWAVPEEVTRDVRRFLEQTYFGGDAYPMWYPNLGPGALTGFLGNAIHFDPEKDTSWQQPMFDDLRGATLRLDENNAYWQATLQWTKRIAAEARGNFVAGIADLGMGADALSSLRGPEGLCLDLLECPEAVKAALRTLRCIWQQCYQRLYELLPPGNGSCCWLQAWAPGTTFPLQNDFSCMVSAGMFEEFFLEDLKAHCDYLEYPVYHLDGPGALKHLDMILSVPSLRAIQWAPGDGQPPMPHWIPFLKRIQAAGKGLFLYLHAHEIETLMSELKPEGVIYHTWACTPAEADQIVASVARWSARAGLRPSRSLSAGH